MIYIIIGIIVLIILYILIVNNSIIKYFNRVKEAFSTMDVYLKKRFDLIPNLVETVKSYANYENKTLEDIIKARNSYDNFSNEKKLEENKKTVNEINKLIALTESYPELKSNENFIKLSDQLTSIENDIANSRKYYNATVREYNNKIGIFPNNIVAKLFNHKEEKMFSVNENERDNVKVKLNK